VAVMVLDGVLERFPRLRGGCIEQGALWVPSLLKRLDIAQSTFVRTEPALDLPLKASEYVHRQLWFTPFPTEPVGWLIEQSGDDRRAPRDRGRVELIVRRPAESEREVLAVGELDRGEGLVGDTWRARSDPPTADGWPDGDMQLTLMSSRVARLVAVRADRWQL